MIVLIWLLNFVISWLNAWGCGKSWTETKHLGGMAHFMNWMGAIMSAAGFTWCYTILACFVGSQFTHEVDGQMVPYLTSIEVTAVAEAGYLVVIGPILGSGLAITVHSWVTFLRKRSLANAAVTGYNTFAQLYNMYEATQVIPSVTSHLSKFFKSDDNNSKNLVLMIVLGAVLGGILTTYAIISSVARHTAFERSLRYKELV